MTPIDLAAALADALSDVIQETPEESLERDPKQVYMEMACRLIVRLAPRVALVPKEHIQPPKPNADQAVQMRTVSDEIMRVFAVYRIEGYDHNVFSIALIDAYVRVASVTQPDADTSTLLRELAAEAEEMAGIDCDATPDEWGKH